MKTLLFLEQFADITAVRKPIAQLADDEVTAVLGRSFTDEQEFFGLCFRWLHTFIDEQQTMTMDNYCWRLANDWWNDLGLDADDKSLLAQGIFWPRVCANEFHNRLIKAHKFVSAFSNAIHVEKPERVVAICCSEYYSNLAALVAEHYHLPIRQIAFKVNNAKMIDLLRSLYDPIVKGLISRPLSLHFKRKFNGRKVIITSPIPGVTGRQRLPENCERLVLSPLRKQPLSGNNNGVFQLSLPLLFHTFTANAAKKYLTFISHLRNSAECDKLFVSGNIDLTDYFFNSLSASVRDNLPGILQACKTLGHILSGAAQVVIAVQDDKSPRSLGLLQSLENAGAKTAIIQHGYPTHIKSPKGFFRAEAEHAIVWGSKFADSYRKFGYAKERIFTVGNPDYDYYFAGQNKKAGERFFQENDLDYKKPIVVWATQQADFFHSSVYLHLTGMIEAFMAAVIKYPEVQWVVRQHPGQYAPDIDLLLSNLGVFFLPHVNLKELLQAATAVYIYSSTVGMEAMVLDKPVLVWDGGGPELTDYLDYGAARRIDSAKAMITAVKDIVIDGRDEMSNNRVAFLKDHLFELDGDASQRMIDSICSLFVQD
jgi:CDP-glycerol glycerophosphotransferase (TagB/SpsB family)